MRSLYSSQNIILKLLIRQNYGIISLLQRKQSCFFQGTFAFTRQVTGEENSF
jgi:hypothetical protein